MNSMEIDTLTIQMLELVGKCFKISTINTSVNLSTL